MRSVYLISFRTPAQALDLAAAPLRLDPTDLGCPGRLRGGARPLDPQGGSEPVAQPVERDGAVAHLRPLVRHDDSHLGAELLDQPVPLTGPEGRRPRDVERQLDASVR